jgi:hypothetical protein
MKIDYLLQFLLYNLEEPIELGSLVGDIDNAHFDSAADIPTTLLYPGKVIYEVMEVDDGEGGEVTQQTLYIVDKDKALIPIIQGNKIKKSALSHDSITELLNDNTVLSKMVKSTRVSHGGITVSEALNGVGLNTYRKRVYYSDPLSNGTLVISGLEIHPYQIIINRLSHTCKFGADPVTHDFSYVHTGGNTVITPNSGISPSVVFQTSDTIDIFYKLTETTDYDPE